ncbi:UNVERIFIED_CONTAM: hypothetical protein FKN15_076457 [Acipenser sinensis]
MVIDGVVDCIEDIDDRDFEKFEYRVLQAEACASPFPVEYFCNTGKCGTDSRCWSLSATQVCPLDALNVRMRWWGARTSWEEEAT